MKSRLVTWVAGLAAILAMVPSTSAIDSNGLLVSAPDAGATGALLALGCTGLAVVAGKRFKR